jgi:hypothetical protein
VQVVRQVVADRGATSASLKSAGTPSPVCAAMSATV